MGTDWIWSALALGKFELLEKAPLEHFDWNAQHSDCGTPLMAVLFGEVPKADPGDGELQRPFDFVCCDKDQRAARLKLIAFALQHGANPNNKAAGNCRLSRQWWSAEEDAKPEVERTTTTYIEAHGLSSMSVVMKCIEAFELLRADEHAADSVWVDEIKFLTSAMHLMTSFSCVGKAPVRHIAVREAVVDMWEAVMTDRDCADVAIVCQDGVEVAAHSSVLRNASKVLKAMLSSTFVEGSSKRIQAAVDARVVKLLLELVYTGTYSEPVAEGGVRQIDNAASNDTKTLTETLDLAHQWQIEHVVDVLAKVLGECLSPDSFSKVCDVAVRLQLPELKLACTGLAKADQGIRECFEKGNVYPETVQDVLKGCFGCGQPRLAKRRKSGL